MSHRVQFKMVVHSATIDQFAATATMDGEDVAVTVPGLVVELVSPDESMTHTLRIRKNVDQAKAAFVPGAGVSATFTVLANKEG